MRRPSSCKANYAADVRITLPQRDSGTLHGLLALPRLFLRKWVDMVEPVLHQSTRRVQWYHGRVPTMVPGSGTRRAHVYLNMQARAQCNR